MTGDGPLRVAIIPARGGSKRIPRKNIRLFDGRPLVAWVIDECLTSPAIDLVVVSTDDEEVADIAARSGASVPFVRPAELSDDHTPLLPVISHAIDALAAQGAAISDVCCVYPTAVGLQRDDLDGGLSLLEQAPAGLYSVAVVRYSHPIQRAMALLPDGRLELVDPATLQTRTQDLPPRWHDAGQFVWGRATTWLQGTSILSHALGYEVPAWRAVDIDNEDDWRQAELTHAVLRSMRLG